MKHVPVPWLLCTVMHPPCCATMPSTTDKPRPVPTPTGFVVKKGSKMRCTVASSIAAPRVRTERCAICPWCERSRAALASRTSMRR